MTRLKEKGPQGSLLNRKAEMILCGQHSAPLALAVNLAAIQAASPVSFLHPFSLPPPV